MQRRETSSVPNVGCPTGAMSNREGVIARIRAAFDGSGHPGDAFLQGSREGCEPYEEIAAFKRRTHWKELDSKTLDEHGDALSFFSEAGFRFFLPAYLVADVRGEDDFLAQFEDPDGSKT